MVTLNKPTTAADYPPLPRGPFSTIVADPPWMYSYSTRTTEVPGTGWRGAGDRHYPTMRFEEICKLDVKSIAADDAVLWLWVVNPLLARGLDLVGQWGFEYKGLLTWAKTQKRNPDKPFFGTGYWMRGATEHVVLATRGRPKPAVRNQVTWFTAQVRAHSQKPDEAYEIFERFVDGPRVDLFARSPRDGWAVWGNEITDPASPGYEIPF